MRYFRPFFEKVDQSKDVDISVRCDIDTFDWLLRYVKNGGAIPRSSAPLSLTNCVQITISSFFLGTVHIHIHNIHLTAL